MLLQYLNELLQDKVTEFLKSKPDPKGEFSFKNCAELHEKGKK